MPAYRWDRIGLLFEDTGKWAEQAYGWGVAFDSDTFICGWPGSSSTSADWPRFVRCRTRRQRSSCHTWLRARCKPSFALAPILKIESTETSDAGEFEAANEIGLALLPVAEDR